MSDDGCLAAICGGCAIFFISAFEPWCNTKRYGCERCCGRCCGGSRGCCHSCFDPGFDKDAWDEEDANRAKAKARDGSKETKEDGVAQQPTAVPEMDGSTAPASTEDKPVA